MNNYYILVLEESIKTFSIVGQGHECKFALVLKGQTTPFMEIEDGDKVIGYISNTVKIFSYLFEAKKGSDDSESVFIKLLETAIGPCLENLSDNVKSKIFDNEQTTSLIKIDEAEYNEIVNSMMNTLSHTYSASETANINQDYTMIQRNPRSIKIHPINFIIYGAPGTGKTYSTAEYALAILNNRNADLSEKTAEERKTVMDEYKKLIKKGRVVFTTFHQSYGYEDFIQGLRPDTTKMMTFKTADGVFKKISDKAMNDNENNYVIIIDEINRANISKVFGELITLIEEDKRWGEINESCATLQSGDIFAVPNNLYIVGTMNSADKSISLIDAALRRRFDFIEQKPDPSLVKDSTLKEIFERLNSKLVDELDSTDLLIGHSYFLNKRADDLCGILNNCIIPLLYEYFYDNRKKVASILSEAIKGFDVEIVDDKISRLSVKNKG